MQISFPLLITSIYILYKAIFATRNSQDWTLTYTQTN